jgi:large subunit ribosomal protein L25
MPTTKQYVKLAESLPPQLQRFFARYPPPSIIEKPKAITIPATTPAAASATPSADGTEVFNPFKPTKHPITGRWHDPVFSLRRQADLVKLARQHGVEELLPHSVKGTEEKLRKRIENGLRVKGTGVGQRVKGKEWERTLKAR